MARAVDRVIPEFLRDPVWPCALCGLVLVYSDIEYNFKLSYGNLKEKYNLPLYMCLKNISWPIEM